jgi:hypothetical protein
MKQRIYIDTSVVGGFFDEEFKEDTIPLFQRFNYLWKRLKKKKYLTQ